MMRYFNHMTALTMTVLDLTPPPSLATRAPWNEQEVIICTVHDTYHLLQLHGGHDQGRERHLQLHVVAGEAISPLGIQRAAAAVLGVRLVLDRLRGGLTAARTE
jgi:hypothetical protein